MIAAQVIAALKQLHDPVEWAVFEELADGTGSGKSCQIDLFALSCWKGNVAKAYEVKVSRSDWRRELDQPTKRRPWERLAHETWFAAPAGIIPKAEVPEGWGLIEVADDLTVRRPVRAREREIGPWPATFVAAIARRSAERRNFDAECQEIGFWRLAGRNELLRLSDLRALSGALHRREQRRPEAPPMPRPQNHRLERMFQVLREKLGYRATTTPEELAAALDARGSALSGMSDWERQTAAKAVRRLLEELEVEPGQRPGTLPPQEPVTLPAVRGAR